MNSLDLAELVTQCRRALGIVHKQDIQTVAQRLTHWSAASTTEPIRLGDDCAAIPDGEGYLLLAAEGMWPLLVTTEPWFAGWCAVMVNVSDIYAMGGRPIAVVDTLWSVSEAEAEPLLQGMQAAAQTYQVPIVGGHTNCHSPYTGLSVAILGRAQRLITSFHAQPGDVLLMVVDLRGHAHPLYPFWNAATKADPVQLRGDFAVLPELAEAGLCDTGKDISMGGVVGTVMMLTETSQVGAQVWLDAIPKPAEVPLERWLLSFPSYGFVLSVRPEHVSQVQDRFCDRNLTCNPIGEVTHERQIYVTAGQETSLLWDFTQSPLTGF